MTTKSIVKYRHLREDLERKKIRRVGKRVWPCKLSSGLLYRERKHRGRKDLSLQPKLHVTARFYR